MKTLTDADRGRPIPVRPSVAACPICGADVVVEDVHEWSSDDGMPTGISVDCTTQPDIDSDEWRGWFRGHWSMPYIDWPAVEMRVLSWFQREYRCG